MGKYKRCFRLFTVFNIAGEEDWLRKMANKGYHFKRVYFLCFYLFEKGTPIDTIYRIDFKKDIDDLEEYYNLYSDNGFKILQNTKSVHNFNYFKYVGDDKSYNSSFIYNTPTEYIDWCRKILIFMTVITFFNISTNSIVISEIILKNSSYLNSFYFAFICFSCILCLFITILGQIKLYQFKKSTYKQTYDANNYKKLLKSKLSLATIIALLVLIPVLSFTFVLHTQTLSDSPEDIENSVLSVLKQYTEEPITLNTIIDKDINDYKIVYHISDKSEGIYIYNNVLTNRYIFSNYYILQKSIYDNNSHYSDYVPPLIRPFDLFIIDLEYQGIINHHPETDSIYIIYKDGTKEEILPVESSTQHNILYLVNVEGLEEYSIVLYDDNDNIIEEFNY